MVTKEVPPSPSGTQNGKKTIISPCLLGPWPRGPRPIFTLGGWVGKEESPKPLGNPKWKKGHNSPLFIGSMAKGAAPDFYTGRGNLGACWGHLYWVKSRQLDTPPTPGGFSTLQSHAISLDIPRETRPCFASRTRLVLTLSGM